MIKKIGLFIFGIILFIIIYCFISWHLFQTPTFLSELYNVCGIGTEQIDNNGQPINQTLKPQKLTIREVLFGKLCLHLAV